MILAELVYRIVAASVKWHNVGDVYFAYINDKAVILNAADCKYRVNFRDWHLLTPGSVAYMKTQIIAELRGNNVI